MSVGTDGKRPIPGVSGFHAVLWAARDAKKCWDPSSRDLAVRTLDELVSGGEDPAMLLEELREVVDLGVSQRLDTKECSCELPQTSLTDQTLRWLEEPGGTSCMYQIIVLNVTGLSNAGTGAGALVVECGDRRRHDGVICGRVAALPGRRSLCQGHLRRVHSGAG